MQHEIVLLAQLKGTRRESDLLRRITTIEQISKEVPTILIVRFLPAFALFTLEGAMRVDLPDFAAGQEIGMDHCRWLDCRAFRQ